MRLSRRAVLGGVALGAFTAAPLRAPVWAATDPAATTRLIASLTTSQPFKMRMHAAALLAAQNDPRSFAALVRASYSDPEPTVRAVVVRLLARNPGGDVAGVTARKSIVRGLGDSSPQVRKSSQEALNLLAKNLELARRRANPGSETMPISVAPTAPPLHAGPLTIRVGRIAGSAPVPVREYMRAEISGQLRRSGRVSVLDDDAASAIYVLDGTIRKLQIERHNRDVEATASVDLVLSKPPRGILMVASGEAVVQKSQRYLASSMQNEVMEEAVGHAVGSAHENLDEFLARQ